MLELCGIKKSYIVGDSTVEALKGIDIEFRKNEFVSILGPSGCGKTTLLNLIGGLDRYTEGDLIIRGKSTKTFKDSDWDTYRNHSIGFVFQSYNLIPHQTVLANVELALTLSGVSKSECRKRAIEALEQVGLGDQLNKRPSQMSGGQMQRVAIARALVNDPDILLADEPTGALDTTTSVQIMEILKEISKDKLIIMVTHNPELAETYSTRIIKVLDGLVIDDSDPYVSEKTNKIEAAPEKKLTRKEKKARKKQSKKTSMSFWTALSLSFNNLRTKKGRTAMTSFAGSIGIIGIALILALSSGINAYITQVQEDTLSTYPLSIQKHTQDMSAMLSAMTNVQNGEDYRDSGMIHVDDSLGTMMGAMSSTVENNLTSFKEYVDSHYDELADYVSDIQYIYDYDLQVFNVVTNKDGKLEARKIGMETVFSHMGDAFAGMSELMNMSGGMSMGLDVFSEMIDNDTLLDQQYDVIAGKWPEEYNEVVLVVNSNNQISKMTLYMLGMLDPSNIEKEMSDLREGNYKSEELPPYTYEDILNLRFKLLTTSEFFYETGSFYQANGNQYPVWNDLRVTPAFDDAKFITDNGVEIKIAGIVRPKEGATAASIQGAVGYTKQLTEYILQKNSESKVINQQKETPKVNVLTGLTFERTKYTRENIDELIDKIDSATMDAFYTFMTNYIKNQEEQNAANGNPLLLNVTRANINTMFMLLKEEQQADILTRIIASAKVNNPTGTDRVFTTLSTMTGNIQVTPDNIITLLPVLNKMETMPIITALGIPGVVNLADATAVEKIVSYVNTNHPELGGAFTKDSFAMMGMMGITAEEQTAIYGELVAAINPNNKTMLSVLCAMISAQAGQEITPENLAEKLPTFTGQLMMIPMITMSGVPGLVDYADADTMEAVYSDMNKEIMNLKVDKNIFTLLVNAMSDEMFETMEATLYGMAPQIDETYESVLKKLDDAEEASPAQINFYAKDFESKDAVEEFIAKYNKTAKDEKRDDDVIQYSDLVGDLMSSVTTIVNAISYVLIAFVSVSLVVSSIMIGIITNISVLERTKEIGILRAIGASKRDISRVFNAETMIIGFAAGFLGIIITVILCWPISAIIQAVSGIPAIRAFVPPLAGVLLVVISITLTLIAGLIPSRAAAKKDPVIALRTE